MTVLTLTLVLSAAAQQTTGALTPAAPDAEPAPIYGGEPVAPGDWDDAAAILDESGSVFCTGTLIAPDVVLSAAHCATGGSADPRSVVLASGDIDGGERIAVRSYEVYPQWARTYDVAVLLLERDAETPPRLLAADCVLDEALYDGALVAVVGYGVTERDEDNELKNEVVTEVTDHDCSRTGRYDCLPEVSPGGELMAGGDGADSCYGDSGGPLYLLTDSGDYLAGVTSRGASYDSDCGEGGIYVRPDAVIDWIEETADVTLERPICDDDSGLWDSGGNDSGWDSGYDYGDWYSRWRDEIDERELRSGLGCSVAVSASVVGALPALLLVGLRRRR